MYPIGNRIQYLRVSYFMCAMIIKHGEVQLDSLHKESKVFINGDIYTFNAETARAFDSRTVDLLRRRAKKFGVPCTITTTSLRTWWLTTPNVCTYCGCTVDEYRVLRDFVLSYKGSDELILRMKTVFNLPNHQKLDRLTKDRIDTCQGYTIDNLCKACWFCSCLRDNFFTAAEWKSIAPMIITPLRVAAGL